MKKIYLLLVLFLLISLQTIGTSAASHPEADPVKVKLKPQGTTGGNLLVPMMSQLTKIAPEDSAVDDFFGFSAALWDDIAVVGAHRDDYSRGAAYVFSRDEGGEENWGQVIKLIANERVKWARFGFSTAVSNNAILVGAPTLPAGTVTVIIDSDGNTEDKDYAQGAVYIFMDETGANDWQQLDMCSYDDTQTCPLRIEDSTLSNIQFGYSLAVWGDTIIVGAPEYNGGNGAVYIFDRDDSGGTDIWVQSKMLTGSGKFGASVALSGDIAIVGAPEDSGGWGAAYVYDRKNRWRRTRTLYGRTANEHLGFSTALWGDKAIIGAPDYSNSSGAAYIYYKNQGGTDRWGYVETVTGAGTSNGKFGSSTAIWENLAIAGAYGENSSMGSAYIFLKDWEGSDNWGQVSTLTADDGNTGDLFGYAVAIHENTAIIGTPKGDGIESDSGSAYAFGKPGIIIKQEDTTISNGGTYDFGSQLAYDETDTTFTIENTGNRLLTVTTPITLDNIYQFQVQEEPASSIESYGTTTFTIRFAADSEGVKTAALSISSSDYYEDPYEITLTGTIIVPEMEVTGNSDFGSTAVNGTALEEEFTISNNGTASLNLTGSPTVIVDGDHADDFTVTVFPDTSEISTGDSTTFIVSFAPSDVGVRSATLIIPNDDFDNNPYELDIQGTGTIGGPSVTTSDVTDVSASSASCGGNVISDGGSSVTQRGVCWDTEENPTYPGSDYTEDGDGTGEFTSTLTGLTASTVYYVRAYAVNSAGIAYGANVNFTSGSEGGNTQPEIETAAISDITETSAEGGGKVVSSGGADVTGRGVCWSTESNPTISDSVSDAGSGEGEFTASITDLTDGTTYYVRAYATNSEGTAYGTEMSFTAGDPIISGTITEDITDEDGQTESQPLADVTVTLSNIDGAGTVSETTSDFNGDYSATVPDSDPFPDGWTGTVTPSKTDYTFTPDSKSFTDVTSDRLMQNFTGTALDTGGTGDTGDPGLSVNLTQLNYTVILSGAQTGAQQLLVANTGGGTLNWTTELSDDWIQVSPAFAAGDSFISVSVDSTGFTLGEAVGTITISDPDADNSPVTVTVYVTIVDEGEDLPPQGEFDTPVDGSTVSGSIPITGWAIDDVEVESVKIYRDDDVYIGDALFVSGARPDIETAYSGYPNNYQAGWGYMLLTHSLPNEGNGVFTLYARVSDNAGNEVNLGSKTITCDNSSAVKPFGAIDFPEPGETASGSNFINWGWALTPMPAQIPTDGSTIHVFVNGEDLGNPVYNHPRADIAALFPGYANSNGAGGYFSLDTTAYTSGVYTISWVVTDNVGNSDGIGSRYFTILNSGTSRSSGSSHAAYWDAQGPLPTSVVLSVRTGWRRDRENQRTLTPGKNNIFYIETRELELVEVLPPAGTVYRAAGLMVDGKHRPLPPGAGLNSQTGGFRWMPGPGCTGPYSFILTGTRTDGQTIRDYIIINIKPKFSNKSPNPEALSKVFAGGPGGRFFQKEPPWSPKAK